jgi:prevent-host-death family protein
MAAKTISHRQLRNDSGRILREVQQGESFIVTNNGQPVAELVPLEQQPLAGFAVKRARRERSLRQLVPVRGSTGRSAQEVLDELRGHA